MAEPTALHARRNQILRRLGPDDLAYIEPHLEHIDLPVRYVIERPHKPIEHVYFPDTGIVSVVAAGKLQKNRIEIGIIGHEGMTGIMIALGDHQSPNSTFVQVAGAGRRIKVDKFRSAMTRSPALHALLLKYTQAFLTQTSQTAVANGKATLGERLARWILMSHDRVEGDVLPLTHEFLSTMLGVRRAGVTLAIAELEKQGIIICSRGKITVLDRSGVMKVAGELYGLPEAEFKRLFGSMEIASRASRQPAE